MYMYLVRQPHDAPSRTYLVDEYVMYDNDYIRREPYAWEWKPKTRVTSAMGVSAIGHTEGEAKKLIDKLRRGGNGR